MAEASAVRPLVVVDDRVGAGPTIVAVICAWLLATRQSIVVPFTLGLTPVSVAFYVAGALLLMCWLARQQISTPHRPTVVLALSMIVATLVSSAALMVRGPAPDQSSESLQLMSRDASLFAGVLLVLVVVRSTADLTRVLQGIVIGAALSATFALVHVAIGVDVAAQLVLPGLTAQESTAMVGDLLRAGVVRPQGSAGHPLELGAVLTVSLPLGLGLTLATRARGLPAWPWALLTGVIALGAVATISRSAIVGSVVALVVMSWRWPVRRVVVGAVALAIGVLGALAAGVPLVARLADVAVGGSADSSIDSRTSGLSYALERLPAHWLFGQGAGTYDVARQPVLDNYYLTRTVETGIVGLAALILLLAGAWVIAHRATSRAITAADPGAFEAVNGVLGALSAVAVIGLILDIDGFAQISTLMYVLVALAGSAAVATRSAHE